MKQSTARKSDAQSISLRLDVVNGGSSESSDRDLSFSGQGWSEDRQVVILDWEATSLLAKALHEFIIKTVDGGKGHVGPYETWLAAELDDIHSGFAERAEALASTRTTGA